MVEPEIKTKSRRGKNCKIEIVHLNGRSCKEVTLRQRFAAFEAM